MSEDMVEAVAEALFFVGLSHNPLYGEAVPAEELEALRRVTREQRLTSARAAIEAVRAHLTSLPRHHEWAGSLEPEEDGEWLRFADLDAALSSNTKGEGE
jgi:hypothetical protein